MGGTYQLLPVAETQGPHTQTQVPPGSTKHLGGLRVVQVGRKQGEALGVMALKAAVADCVPNSVNLPFFTTMTS